MLMLMPMLMPMLMRKTRREFTDGFKREAVVLLRDGGRPLTQVAAGLGLESLVLRRGSAIEFWVLPHLPCCRFGVG